MKKNLQAKLDDLRQQPEHVRIRTAAIFSAIGGFVILLIWMFALLPLELANKRGSGASSAPSPTVAGTTSNTATATDTPLDTTNPVYAITPSPVVTQLFQALPSNAPADTTSPSPSPSFSSLPVATTQPK